MGRKLEIAVTFIIVVAIIAIFAGFSLNEIPADDWGLRFHYKTSPQASVEPFRPSTPEQYKTYEKAEKIELPEPNFTGISVEKAIAQRRSVRNYSDEPLQLKQLSQLLFAAQGITTEEGGRPLRAAPSAGATYPFEVYVVVCDVEQLKKGIYHYDVTSHSLSLVKEGDFAGDLSAAAFGQDSIANAPATFILTAVFNRTRSKYGQRGLRFIYNEAGHISQNLYLQAESMGLGTVVAGGFIDEKVNNLLELDGQKEAAIYLQPVGKK